MSKKHFIALADTLRATRPSMTHDVDENGHGPMTPEYKQWCKDVEFIALFCKRQNSAFNYDRWIDYIECTYGPNGGVIKP